MLQRRNLAIMLGLCLLLTACTGFVTVAKEENLITNGDFEQGTRGWSFDDMAAGKTAEDYVVDGCFAITKSTAGDTTTISRDLRGMLEANTTYILSFDRNVNFTGGSNQRLYIQLNDTNTPNSSYVQGDAYLRPRASDGWVRTTVAFTTPEGFNPNGDAYIKIVCRKKAFEENDLFAIDNMKLIESSEWIGFKGNASTSTAIRTWNNGTSAETSRITDLGDKSTGYEPGNDWLCTKYYTASATPASVTIAIYEMTGDTPRLVCVYQTDVSAVENQVNTPYKGAEDSLQTVLVSGKTYTTKVFAWDSVSGLSPRAASDTLTFTYTAPASEA